MSSTSSFIPGWYAILPANLVKMKTPLGITCFNLDLVFFRAEEGEVYCFLDRCPHRGAKLSLGNIKHNCIECPYHGFKFNLNGACELAPEFNQPLPGLKLKRYSVKESMGMIWILYGSDSKEFNFPELRDLHEIFQSSYCETSKVWNSHITYCVENQLDYTHLPSVHKNTIGRGFKFPQDPTFTLDECKITIGFNDKQPMVDFYFPNIWVLHVSKNMKLLVYFVPINEVQTMLYLRSYNSLLRFNLTNFLLSPIFNKLNKIILKQDQRVVCSQGSLPSYLAVDDVLMKNDRAIKYFRKLWGSWSLNHFS